MWRLKLEDGAVLCRNGAWEYPHVLENWRCTWEDPPLVKTFFTEAQAAAEARRLGGNIIIEHCES